MPTFAHFETTLGNFTAELFDAKVPKTVANFVGLAEGSKEWTHPKTHERQKKPFYDGIIFHRVIDGFMLQGGDPLGQGYGGPGYQFEDEFHPDLRHDAAGVLSMANAGPNTNGSQFFIVSGQSGVGLPPLYSLFGKVVKGLDVLETMQRVSTNSKDRPDEDVVIKSVTIDVADE
jgi:peptidyl-prolyl cis-trans isomerase A (cyclophilin A)